MKTIFDQIDLKYLECTTGTCEHIVHQPNQVLILIIAVYFSYCLHKYIHEQEKDKNYNKSKRSN